MTKKYTDNNIQEVAELRESIDEERRGKKMARSKLVSKRLVCQPEADLPGGFWKDTSCLVVINIMTCLISSWVILKVTACLYTQM